MDVTLTVQHNIFLTKEERYTLHAGEPIEVIGISVPVWLYGEETTSEPAKEVFCRYYLYNTKEDLPIKTLEDGYEICVPHKIPENLPDASNEEWKEFNEDQLEAYYESRENTVTSQNLLDVTDGGSGSIMYREHNSFEKNGSEYEIIHFIHITTIEKLIETMEYPILKDNPEELEQGEE